MVWLGPVVLSKHSRSPQSHIKEMIEGYTCINNNIRKTSFIACTCTRENTV